MKFWFRPMIEAGSPAGGGAGTPPPAASASPTPESTPGTGSTPPSPSGNNSPAPNKPNEPVIEDGNWRQLRTQYETTRQQLQELTSRSAQFSAVHTRATEMATALGYTAEDFTEAFAADPVATIALLNQEFGERQNVGDNQPNASGTPDLAEQIRQEAQRQIAPVNEIVNRQITEAAMTKYNSAVDSVISTDPVLSTAPPEIHSLVKDYLEEYFSTQPAILLAMKTKGDYSAVAPTAQFIAGRLQAAFTAWTNKSNPPTPGGAPAPQQRNARPSLDDIINDPGVLGKQYR